MYAQWIPVAVIQVWVGPIGSYKMLCGPHRQQMYAQWIPVAVIQVWVGPIGSYRMLGETQWP